MVDLPNLTSLDEWADKIAAEMTRSAEIRSNETELREDVEGTIRDALGDLYGVTPESITAETNTKQPGQGHSPVDKIYGGVLVEYEWAMGNSRRRHGADQALGYLKNIRASQGGTRDFTAIVCDGRQWGFLVVDPDEDHDLFTSAPSDAADHFQWLDNSAASARRFLLLCGAHSKAPVTGTALARAFGSSSLQARTLVQLLAIGLGGRKPGDRTDTLFLEWKQSTDVVYGTLDSLSDSVVDPLRGAFQFPNGVAPSLAETLFVLHTYFSLVARLISGEVLALALGEREAQPTLWAPLNANSLAQVVARFDAGELPENLDVQNLFETDVFSWYVDLLDGDEELLNALRGILEALDTFAFPRVTFGAQKVGDNLRELYQSLIPRTLRKQLGEYPTPSWLAEASLAALADAGADLLSGRVLDPTCGTGAFLLPVLRTRLNRLRRSAGEDASSEQVQAVLDSVVGIDINPVAVTATRANFVVALGDLATLGALTVSVWRSDSIARPEPRPGQQAFVDDRLQGKDLVHLDTSLPEPFSVPASVSGLHQVALIRDCVEQALHGTSLEESRTRFLRELDLALSPGKLHALEADGSAWLAAREVLEVLFERIWILDEEGRDGVWARIIENSFAPVFAGEFEVVVGNPPWLGWSKLPERWREKASKYWKRYGLWSVPRAAEESSQQFAQRNDLATLVFATALAQYSARSGFVGLLVPEALILADPGARAFRRYHLKSEEGETGVDLPFSIVSCDNWSDVGPFGSDAANNPVFLVARSGERHQWPVPTRKWKRTKRGTQLPRADWKQVRQHLTAIGGESNPINRNVPWSAWSFAEAGVNPLQGGQNDWSFGMGVNVRGAAGVYYVDVLADRVSAGLVKIRNVPDEGRNEDVRSHTQWVESDSVYPLVRGRDIRPWRAQASGYIPVPHDPQRLSKHLSDDELSKKFPKLLKWLLKHKAVLQKRKPPTKSWDIHGRDWSRLQAAWEHIDGPFLVVVPEQRMPPPAAILRAEFDAHLGRKVVPLPNHKVTFCAVATFDEAVYVAAVLNATPIQALLESFASDTAVSPTTMSRVPIPRYDPGNDDVDELVRLGREVMAAKPGDRELARDERRERMDELVSQLLNQPDASAPSVRSSRLRESQKADVAGVPASQDALEFEL